MKRYYCSKCGRQHNADSKIGRQHLRYATHQNPPTSPQLQKAIEKRIEFHGVPPRKLIKVPITSRQIPEVLVVLGELYALEYIPVTPTGETTKKIVRFRHESGDIGGGIKVGRRPLLCTDPEGENLYIIKPPGCKMFVTDWIYG
jgi:hypothetical protein